MLHSDISPEWILHRASCSKKYFCQESSNYRRPYTACWWLREKQGSQRRNSCFSLSYLLTKATRLHYGCPFTSELHTSFKKCRQVCMQFPVFWKQLSSAFHTGLYESQSTCFIYGKWFALSFSDVSLNLTSLKAWALICSGSSIKCHTEPLTISWLKTQ